MKGFSADDYHAMLSNLLSNGYTILSYRQYYHRYNQDSTPLCLLRHDIDFNPESALTMIEVERDLQVCASYYFMIEAEAYNLVAPSTMTVISRLINHGFDTGLHYDNYSRYSLSSIDEQIAAFRLLTGDNNVKFVTLHRPLDHSISSHTSVVDYTGFKYFADSYGCWRFGHPLESDAFLRCRNMVINTHPEWWGTPPDVSPLFVLSDLYKNRIDAIRRWMLANCYGLGKEK